MLALLIHISKQFETRNVWPEGPRPRTQERLDGPARDDEPLVCTLARVELNLRGFRNLYIMSTPLNLGVYVFWMFVCIAISP